MARIAAGVVHLWEDGAPTCMAFRSGRTPNGVRIGYEPVCDVIDYALAPTPAD